MKLIIKYVLVFIAIILLAIGVFYAVRYFLWRASDDYLALEYTKHLEDQYKNDIYGGFTPEETLQLFIDALKKGDVDLAAKYFVIEKQDERQQALTNWSHLNKLPAIIATLEKAGGGKEIFPGNYELSVANENNETEFIIDLRKNELTEKWKLEDF
ncbi:MAG: hypothetical protein A3H71_00115 [Candidatus Sungbacteria bacterium RIFCSPLOWO2_02_FULL_48_13b]|uniref:Uncharacterized protein n=3 Tax=Parcubacteria group TaxID=1794811 RepID=A0A0G1U3J0_9BACT|nr:MAG: hypothetical protein UY19_C0026G0003 [Candidatus Wolfebacteria bacterium GW2011_GWA2_47_9b]OHA00782.1 MAG: hypothetical protein A3C12_01400 [Candidatus Sungbacteria bacterium RIFCSPHIGHO2_02_FULL_49_20]OHA11103.1 MAG: hypothetical protein A3H71_00115 [Candidatus Sungbacteria bacterium RIFCSPLOWO2_02_FULL_48_13b]